MAHDVELRVRYGETDQMQVVYHSNYLDWCDVGRTETIRALWGSYADVEASGVALAVVEACVRYHAPARYDEVIRVRTTVSEVKSRSVRFDYVITNAKTGRRLATAHTVLVAITRDAAAAVTRIPEELRAALAAAL